MRAGECPHCHAELPEAGRFCVMCGRSIGAADAESEKTPQRPSEPSQPGAGHALRDSSPDRRVYTSPLGHVVPLDVLAELREAGAAVQLRSRDSEKTARIAIAPAATRPGRPRAAAAPALPLDEEIPPQSRWRPVVHGLLWAALLAWLGVGVGWAVYQLSHPPPSLLPAASPSAPPPAAPPAEIGRRSAPSARPTGHELSPASPAVPPAVPPAAPPSLGAAPIAAPASAVARGAALPAAPAAMPATNSRAWLRLHDDVEFVASAHSPQVRACYERAFRHADKQAPAGRIELSFTLIESGDAGRAVDIVTELNLLGEPSVGACLAERLAEWRFPRPPILDGAEPSAAPPRLRYPFVFAPAP